MNAPGFDKEKWLKENPVVDSSDEIREAQQSRIFRAEVPKLISVINQHKGRCSIPNLRKLAETAAPTLNQKYHMVFSRVVREEISTDLLYKFIDCLEDIEQGRITQMDASYVIGDLLKREFVDPVVASIANERPTPNIGAAEMTWDIFNTQIQDSKKAEQDKTDAHEQLRRANKPKKNGKRYK